MNWRLSILAIGLVGSSVALGQVKNPKGIQVGQFKLPKFALVKGPVKLSSKDLTSWQRMISNIAIPQPQSQLFVLKATSDGSFPGPFDQHNIYRKPVAPVQFSLGMTLVKSSNIEVEIQYSTSSYSTSPLFPFTGWQNPIGLISKSILMLPTTDKPSYEAAKVFETSPDPKNPNSVIQTKVPAKYATFSIPMPIAGFSEAGTSYFVRVIPFSNSNGVKVPLAPPTNWIPITLTYSKDEQVLKAAIDAAEAKRAKDEAQVKASTDVAIQYLKKAYSIRILSYIPPKFRDDPAAMQNFLCTHDTQFAYKDSNGNQCVTNIGVGQTYDMTEVKNLINSEKSWEQDLWDVTSATLNMASSAYQGAKSGLVNGIADGIEVATGQKVPPEVRAAMLTGLNMAIAYCGIPPSIPNIDQIYNRGIDYLSQTVVDEAISQATGISVEQFGVDPATGMAVGQQVKKPATESFTNFLNTLTHPAPFEADNPESWGIPAPFFRRRPAMLYLQIQRNPGSTMPINESWQSLTLSFGAYFLPLANVAMPKKPDAGLIIPIALAPNSSPDTWRLAGTMREQHTDSDDGYGQPYYYDMGTTNVTVISNHKLLKEQRSFSVNWGPLDFDPARVDAIPFPKGPYLTKAEFTKAIAQTNRVLAPDNYYGKIQYIDFSTPY